MKKKLYLVIFMLLSMSGVALATPLTDYSPGSVDINIGFGWAGDGSNAGGSISVPGGYNPAWLINQDFGGGSGGALDLGVTVGVGSNIALRFKNNVFSGNTYNWNDQWISPWWYTGDSVTGYLSDPEFDIMWQACSLDRTPFSLTALIGFDVPIIGAIGSSSVGNVYQGSMIGGGVLMGVQGVVPVGDTTSVFATADLGTSRWGAGIGVGFSLAQNIDLNLGVDYRSYFLSSINSNFSGNVYSCQPKIGVDIRL